MWIKKPNPPTPFPARKRGEFLSSQERGWGRRERSSLVARS